MYFFKTNRVNYLFMSNKKLTSDKYEAFSRLCDVLKEKGMTPPDFYHRLGVEHPSQTWNNWKNRGIPRDKYQLICDLIPDLNFEYLATGKGEKLKSKSSVTMLAQKFEGHESQGSEPRYTLGEFDLWDENTPLRDDEVALPFFREVEFSAGPGRHEVIENQGMKLRFAKSTLKKKSVPASEAACVTVSGKSMEPVYPDGCTVGIDKSKNKLVDGDIFAIDHDGELRVKIMYKLTGGGIRLRSFNIDEYPDENYSAKESVNIRILGRVFWWSALR